MNGGMESCVCPLTAACCSADMVTPVADLLLRRSDAATAAGAHRHQGEQRVGQANLIDDCAQDLHCRLLLRNPMAG